MRLLSRLFAEQEISEQDYSAEVLCANWVGQPLAQAGAPGRAVALEGLRETDAPTFLARIYACQRC